MRDPSSVSSFNLRVRLLERIRLNCITSDLAVAQFQDTTVLLNPTTDATTFQSPLTTTEQSLQWNPAGVTVASGYGNASVLSPYAVFVDDNYFIYIAEKANSRISKWPPNPTGAFSTFVWRTNVGELNAPPSLYVDSPTGDVYVADEGNHRVRYFANGSTTGVSIPSPSAGSNPNVNGLFLDPNRTVFITDTGNNRIYQWLTNQTVAGGNGAGSNANQFNQPKRFFIDKNFTFYVADSTNQRIQKWMPNTFTGQTVAGGNGVGPGLSQLSSPLGTVVDSQGNVLVCDYSNNRVQKWTPNATVGQTVAGSASGVPGTGPDQLTSPRGIAIDKDDNLYIADGGTSYRIQKFSVV